MVIQKNTIPSDESICIVLNECADKIDEMERTNNALMEKCNFQLNYMTSKDQMIQSLREETKSQSVTIGYLNNKKPECCSNHTYNDEYINKVIKRNKELELKLNYALVELDTSDKLLVKMAEGVKQSFDELKQLAQGIHDNHFSNDNFELLDSYQGVISQISNMVSGMFVPEPKQPYKPKQFMVGQRVLICGTEIGKVVTAKEAGKSPAQYPNDDRYVWVWSGTKGYPCHYSTSNISPLPNGQL